MADNVGKVNMNDAMLSVNTVSIKEEQEDSFIEEKVYFSETTITTNNIELQDHIWHGKVKDSGESTYLDSIKTELASFEATDIQTDKIKVEDGICADFKSEFDNGLLYCEHCEAYYKDYCIECGMLAHILNKPVPNIAGSGAREDIPYDILEIQDCLGQTGIYALKIIPAGVTFGPFIGLSTTECLWETEGEKFVLDKSKSKYLNWMQYVNPTRNIFERNLLAFQCEDNIYYESTRQIQVGEQLLVYFDEECRNSLNKIVGVSTTKDIVKDTFACTFCCLGFSSKSHLAKHKTLCVEGAAGNFSIEELAQCPLCKIYMDQKEYFEQHMAFCYDMNTRRCIVPTSSAKQTTTALNGRKRRLHQIYKCKQCKYRTKYQADLKEHTNNHHFEVKMRKYGVCDRRFKSLRLHVEDTHTYIGGKDDQVHATTDYRNTHIKVDESRSQDQEKVYECSLCVFRTKYKQSLRRHMKTKYLNKVDYKCDSCKYRTNDKLKLEAHIKTKHLKQFDYKCDSCEFGTNRKHHLKVHVKTKHLKQFDLKCEFCGFGTNKKNHLEIHIKSQHLKEFDYKCHSCEFGTNVKNDLKMHTKTKHLKQFDFKCNTCEFGTNSKAHLKIHIKTKHLNEFDFKCDKCEYRTNNVCDFEVHIKTKHLKEFDFKCDLCGFRTNLKRNFERHVKTKHLKKFDYKCDFCEFETNRKNLLKIHIKTKHFKEFDYKCDRCEYRTNVKGNFTEHIKRNHI